jgi:hypothetical protein
MLKFSELNITLPTPALKGKRIEIEDILNTEIPIYDFSIELSKFPKKPGDKCMYMQTKVDDKDRVILTIGKTLIALMEQADKTKLPFSVKIIKIDKRYEFS